MKRSFLYIVFFVISYELNSQQMNLNNKGIGDIMIGKTVIGIPGIKPLSDYQYFNKFSKPEGGYGPFHFYYYEDSLLVVDSLGKIPKFFIATDEKEVIVEMEMKLDSTDANINDRFIEILGKPNLLSNSSIGGIATNSKLYWHINEISIFLTTYSESRKREIHFTSLHYDVPTAIISFMADEFFRINF